MNADVEKAVGVITDHIADLTRCIGVLAAYPEMKPVASEFEKAMKELAPVAQALRDQEAEIARLHESTHYANGVADLAMKHRDAAEQRAEKAEVLLRECDAVARKRGDKYGLCDAIDNDGQPYQSAHLAAHLGGEHE